MNRILRIDEEKPEMHITVQDYKVTLCFAEKENPEVAVLVKQALLSAMQCPGNRTTCRRFCIQKI